MRARGGSRRTARAASRRGARPEAIRQLQESGIAVEGLRSKSWDEFAAEGAPEFKFVFTVCDNAAKETCPVWPGIR